MSARHHQLVDDLVAAVRALEEAGPFDDDGVLVKFGTSVDEIEHDTIVLLHRTESRLVTTFSVLTPAPGEIETAPEAEADGAEVDEGS